MSFAAILRLYPRSPAVAVFALLATLAVACGGSGSSGTGPTAAASTPRPSPTAVKDPMGLLLYTDAQGLYVWRLSEDKLTPIVKYSDGSAIGFPAVSPDGKRVAFALQLAGGKAVNGVGTDIMVADIDGKNLRQVAAHSKVNEFLQSPQWLGDHELVFDVHGPLPGNAKGYFRVDKLDLATNARTTLAENAVRPAVSADQKWLAYGAIDPNTGIDHLVLTTPDVAPPVSITPDDRRIVLITYVVFSPDSSKIAFAAQDLQRSSLAGPGGGGRLGASSHPGAQDIWTVNRDGSGLRKIADLGDANPAIAFGNDNNTIFVNGTTGFWRMDIAAGTSQKLTTKVPFGEIARIPQ
jgi:Tol biopolymer transport system component